MIYLQRRLDARVITVQSAPTALASSRFENARGSSSDRRKCVSSYEPLG